MVDSVQEVVEYVSEKQLSKNQTDHNKAAREFSNYKGDHKFVDLEGKEHSIAVGAIALDDNGEKRVYNHIITGE